MHDANHFRDLQQRIQQLESSGCTEISRMLSAGGNPQIAQQRIHQALRDLNAIEEAVRHLRRAHHLRLAVGGVAVFFKHIGSAV